MARTLAIYWPAFNIADWRSPSVPFDLSFHVHRSTPERRFRMTATVRSGELRDPALPQTTLDGEEWTVHLRHEPGNPADGERSASQAWKAC